MNESDNKRIAKNSLLLYFRMLILMVVGLYTSRIVLTTLGIKDYGLYNVVGGIVVMFSFLSGAMSTATQRFLSYELGNKNINKLKIVFTTASYIHLGLAFIILCLAETIGLWFLNKYMNIPVDKMNAANWVYQFSVFSFMITIISVPYNASIIAHEKMSAFAYIGILEAVLKLLIVFLLLYLAYDKLIIYAFLIFMVALAINVIYRVYCSHFFEECHIGKIWNKNQFKDMSNFVSWNLIGSTAMVAKEQGLNIVLNIFCGVGVNAARAIAYQIMAALGGFINNFQTAINPQIIKSYSSNDKENMFSLVKHSSRFSFYLLFILSLPVIMETPIILRVWLKLVPDYSIIFVRIVLITALIDTLSGTLITSMHASGKIRNYQIIVGGISLMTLPLAYIVLKLKYEPYYAMIISLLVSIFCLIARLLLLKKTISFPSLDFFKTVILKCILVSALSSIIPFLLITNIEKSIGTSFLVVFVCLFSSFASIFYIGITKNEQFYLINRVKTLAQKNKR